MDSSSLLPAASTSAETFFFIIAGSLVVLALATAAIGIRREDFPSPGALRGLLGLFALLVLATGAGAVLTARDEQEIRRAENARAAQEAEAQALEKEQEEEALGAGEAAQPGGATGEASSPQEDAPDGKALFVASGCGGCHTLADAGTSGEAGPALDEVLPGQDPAAIRTSIVDPDAAIAKGFAAGVMPANFGDQLSEAEIDALVSYLGDVAGKK